MGFSVTFLIVNSWLLIGFNWEPNVISTTDCIFQAHFLHATDFLYKCSVLQLSSIINYSSLLRWHTHVIFESFWINLVINFSMLDRQEEKISRSLMTICNVFCFGEPDYWRKRIMCSGFVSIINSFLGRFLRERLIHVASF